MRVFDVHVHIQPWEMLLPGPRALMDDAAHRDAVPLLEDPRALLAHLDREGVERICCINYVAPDVMGFTAAANDWIAGFTKEHRDRLLPVGSVHPQHTPDARAEISRVLDLGIRMIKIHPLHQRFAANAYLESLPGLADVYSECERRGVPVMIHTGTSIFPGARNRFADPMAVDDVAIDFPRLRIIMAHAGRPLYADTAFFLLRRHANVFADISGIPPRSLPKFFPRLEEVSEKVLWGTDWPSPGVTSMRANVEAFRACGYRQQTQDAVLWENSARLFA